MEAADATMTDRDARALLDSVSYQCPFVSEHFAQRLHLSWYSQNTDISGSCL